MEFKSVHLKDTTLISSEDAPKDEEWRELPFGEGYFEISNYGRVRSLDRWTVNKIGQQRFYRGKHLKPSVIKYKNEMVGDEKIGLFCRVRWSGQTYSFYIHRLVFHVFVKPIDFKDDELLILHIDGDGRNNHVSNLIESTFSQKALHIYQQGRGHKVFEYITPNSRKIGIVNRMRVVSQYQLSGKRIGIFKSIKEASEITGISASAIVAVCKQRGMVSAGGYLWQYGQGSEFVNASSYKEVIERRNVRKQKRVSCYALTGKLIATYESIREAAQKQGLNYLSVSECLRGKTITSGGLLWRYGSGSEIEAEFLAHNAKIFEKSLRSKARPVAMICPTTGDILARFCSLNKAAQAIGYSNSSDIGKAAQSGRRKVKGRYWEYLK